MSAELLLARRLIEAAVDPDATISSAEDALAELGEIAARLGAGPGRSLRIDAFEGMSARDLSPSAWLFVLESVDKERPEIPENILEDLFVETSDEVVRFRLVSGALSQPGVRSRYTKALDAVHRPERLSDLPGSWPKSHIQQLEFLASTEDGSGAARQALTEFVLYLLQDGSDVALGLAAASVSPAETADEWRMPARDLARNIAYAARRDETFRRAFERLLDGG